MVVEIYLHYLLVLGQVVKVNSSANGFEFGSGFEGNYVLHAHDRYTYGSNKTMGSISIKMQMTKKIVL